MPTCPTYNGTPGGGDLDHDMNYNTYVGGGGEHDGSTGNKLLEQPPTGGHYNTTTPQNQFLSSGGGGSSGSRDQGNYHENNAMMYNYSQDSYNSNHNLNFYGAGDYANPNAAAAPAFGGSYNAGMSTGGGGLLVPATSRSSTMATTTPNNMQLLVSPGDQQQIQHAHLTANGNMNFGYNYMNTTSALMGTGPGAGFSGPQQQQHLHFQLVQQNRTPSNTIVVIPTYCFSTGPRNASCNTLMVRGRGRLEIDLTQVLQLPTEKEVQIAQHFLEAGPDVRNSEIQRICDDLHLQTGYVHIEYETLEGFLQAIGDTAFAETYSQATLDTVVKVRDRLNRQNTAIEFAVANAVARNEGYYTGIRAANHNLLERFDNKLDSINVSATAAASSGAENHALLLPLNQEHEYQAFLSLYATRIAGTPGNVGDSLWIMRGFLTAAAQTHQFAKEAETIAKGLGSIRDLATFGSGTDTSTGSNSSSQQMFATAKSHPSGIWTEETERTVISCFGLLRCYIFPNGDGDGEKYSEFPTIRTLQVIRKSLRRLVGIARWDALEMEAVNQQPLESKEFFKKARLDFERISRLEAAKAEEAEKNKNSVGIMVQQGLEALGILREGKTDWNNPS
ncbi:unnamed protein product [Amoebophrya sp. A120]|nr:unnamed protein product [Amoebophrya sp. A120]|eukprot:GSA120T00001447001.1